jgi:hypothetical protein
MASGMDVSESLEKAQSLLASGDVAGLLAYLRTDGEALPLGEVARLVAGAAQLAGFDDLAQAGAAVASGDGSGTQDALALYHFGYACTEHGAACLAVRPLARALELAPDAAPVLSELVAALEQNGQHARAVAVLEEHDPVMQWLHRYQYVYNALIAGDLDKAAAGFRRLPEPEDAAWIPARDKVRRMLARADTARAVTPLDRQDLRGWHYVLTGGILASLSPYGFDAGMTGRWCYVSDSAAGCATALARLRLILDTSGTAPQSVALLPDRSSRILGTAAAEMLGLPTADLDPRKPAAHSLAVAYDLTQTDPDAVTALRDRAPARSCSSGQRAGPIHPAPPPTSAACSARSSSRRGPGNCAASTTAPPAQARQMTARPRPSPPRSPAAPLSTTKATAALPRTRTKTCAASPQRSPPQAHANVTAAGWAASASTSPTPARYPAAASSDPAPFVLGDSGTPIAERTNFPARRTHTSPTAAKGVHSKPGYSSLTPSSHLQTLGAGKGSLETCPLGSPLLEPARAQAKAGQCMLSPGANIKLNPCPGAAARWPHVSICTGELRSAQSESATAALQRPTQFSGTPLRTASHRRKVRCVPA